MTEPAATIEVRGAAAHNLKQVDVTIDRGTLTVVTGVSGSGKSSLAFDTVLAEAQRRFFYTLSHYSRQFLDLSSRPAVRSITGLSPAISVAQNETPPSRRATVGTITDLSELLAVLMARFGAQLCPTHNLATAAMTPEAMATHIMEDSSGQTIAICAPVVTAKKGVFKAQLTQFAARGYTKASIDGALVSLTPVPQLNKELKHTIKIIIDTVKIKPEAASRLRRSIETALAEGQGFVDVAPCDARGKLDESSLQTFAAAGGCPQCGFSWPRLDSRHFSANSLGQCKACRGLGYDTTGLGSSGLSDEEAEADSSGDLSLRARLGLDAPCQACRGTGLSPELSAIRLGEASPLDLQQLTLLKLEDWLTQLIAHRGSNPALARVADEALATVRRINGIGLGYLTLARRLRSLSGGESQRLKLAGILVEDLRGVLYVLDEPSQGLHASELDQLVMSLRRLTASGNTVLMVDHDERLMRAADWIIDLGPGGGMRGGRLMAKFKPTEAARFARESLTAKYLASANSQTIDKQNNITNKSPAIIIEGAHCHNLAIDSVRFPLGGWCVVTGVSGAGKSSLVLQTLYPNLVALLSGSKKPPTHAKKFTGADAVTAVHLVDRRPIAKSGVSMPVTYLDVLGELRDIYAAQSDAQVMGLTARSFSLSVEGGRCPECKGRGELSLTMRFLADARVRCPVCKGQRFQTSVLGVRYLGLSLAQVLELTLDEALDHFKNHRKIVQRLSPAVELGLGYLKLGQPSASLSGGEAQRLKLVPYLGRRIDAGTLLILDEPTTGLHFADVDLLLGILRRLVAAGATVVTVEHNESVIAAADWVIELGPGAAHAGGKLVRQGQTDLLECC
ncbi:MAG: excinuclease ABC subunit UvrA [Deltaproteobacteria bacterium]|nr:excinuclease ABC subunit UvrA [Deltaproteobacteria bacterium]